MNIPAKIDLLKAAVRREVKTEDDKKMVALADIGLDLLGDLLTNIQRIADAAEKDR
jgi:hypothetical protein